MRSAVLLTLVTLLSFGPTGCKKKPRNEGKSPDQTTAMTGDMAGDTAGGMAARPKAVSGYKSAAEACAKGVLPTRPVDKPEYKLTVQVPTEATVGQSTKATLTLVPKPGYKVNLKYPIELNLKAPDSVKLVRKKLNKTHAKTATHKELTFEVEFTHQVKGKQVVRGELGFSVCTPKLCITEPDMCVAWEVTAK